MHQEVRCPRCGSKKTSRESKELTEKRRPRTRNERSRAAALALFLGVFVAVVAWFVFTATGSVEPRLAAPVSAVIGLALAGYVYLQAEVIVSVGRQEQYRCANCGRTWERQNVE